jgi:uncharacterized protein
MMELSAYGFDWDEGNREKCQKHGVSLEKIEQLFLQSLPYITPDVKHSDNEERFIAAGTVGGRALFVVFTIRQTPQGYVIRPVSARYMHLKEASRYEQESSPDADR